MPASLCPSRISDAILSGKIVEDNRHSCRALRPTVEEPLCKRVLDEDCADSSFLNAVYDVYQDVAQVKYLFSHVPACSDFRICTNPTK